MGELVKYVDIAIGNEEDCQKSLGIKIDIDIESGELPAEKYQEMTRKILALYRYKEDSNYSKESHSADYNGWSAVLDNGEDFCF